MSGEIERLAAMFKKNPGTCGDISCCRICPNRVPATNYVAVAGFGIPMFFCQECFSKFTHGVAYPAQQEAQQRECTECGAKGRLLPESECCYDCAMPCGDCGQPAHPHTGICNRCYGL